MFIKILTPVLEGSSDFPSDPREATFDQFGVSGVHLPLVFIITEIIFELVSSSENLINGQYLYYYSTVNA